MDLATVTHRPEAMARKMGVMFGEVKILVSKVELVEMLVKVNGIGS